MDDGDDTQDLQRPVLVEFYVYDTHEHVYPMECDSTRQAQMYA